MLGRAQAFGAKIPVAVRKGGEEGSPSKFSLLFHKGLPWKPCMKHRLKGCLIVFSVWHLQAHSGSNCTRMHHGIVNGSSSGHMAGGREGLLINECAHWHPQGLAGGPGAGNPEQVNSRSCWLQCWQLPLSVGSEVLSPHHPSPSSHQLYSPGPASPPLPGPALGASAQGGKGLGQCRTHGNQAWITDLGRPEAHSLSPLDEVQLPS